MLRFRVLLTVMIVGLGLLSCMRVKAVEMTASSNLEFANKVASPYEHYSYLYIEGCAKAVLLKFHGEGVPIRTWEYWVRFVQHMTPDKVRLDFFRATESGKDELLAVIIVKDGRVYELRPEATIPNKNRVIPDQKLLKALEGWEVTDYTVRRLLYPSGVSWILATYSTPTYNGKKVVGILDQTIQDGIKGGEMCIISYRYETWLGHGGTEFTSTLRKWVREGEILSDPQVVSGKECMVVIWRKVNEAPRGVPWTVVEHVLFFDVETHDFVRWDSFTKRLGKVSLHARKRVHKTVRFGDKVPEGTFELPIPTDGVTEELIYPR